MAPLTEEARMARERVTMEEYILKLDRRKS
jgi:hypothetical protein